MANYRFVQLDVFTDQPFQGNPLAVFPEAEGLTDEQMLKIAREMNLSESVFVLPPRSADTLKFLRIFTPTREVPFAGHPVVGTWNALALEGLVSPPEGGAGWTRIHHEVGIGRLPVDIEFKDGVPVQVAMTQGKFEIIDEIDDQHLQAEIARALGRHRDELDESLPIQIISTGLRSLVVPIRALADLRNCRVNSDLLSELYLRVGAMGVFAFSRETLEIGSARAHARFFAPADNIPEDPATGSACGALGAYLVYHNADGGLREEGKSRFVIEQGDFINRPSRISLEVSGSPGAIEAVRVSGASVVVARGEVLVAG